MRPIKQAPVRLGGYEFDPSRVILDESNFDPVTASQNWARHVLCKRCGGYLPLARDRQDAMCEPCRRAFMLEVLRLQHEPLSSIVISVAEVTADKNLARNISRIRQRQIEDALDWD